MVDANFAVWNSIAYEHIWQHLEACFKLPVTLYLLCIFHFCSIQNVWSQNYHFRRCVFLLGVGSLEWESNSCKIREVQQSQTKQIFDGGLMRSRFKVMAYVWLTLNGFCTIDLFYVVMHKCHNEPQRTRSPKALSPNLMNIQVEWQWPRSLKIWPRWTFRNKIKAKFL